MTYDLTKFDLGDMLKCSLRLRETATGAATLEASAQRVCRFLYDELHGPGVPRACAPVRAHHTPAAWCRSTRHTRSVPWIPSSRTSRERSWAVSRPTAT